MEDPVDNFVPYAHELNIWLVAYIRLNIWFLFFYYFIEYIGKY